jgi:uncharacterized repeat protein (TIGR04042 family)
MHYRLQWPDASITTCYSPSLVVKDYLEPGASYELADFLRRVRAATRIASDRVSAKFGFACSRASDQLATIEELAAQYADRNQARVQVLEFLE